MMQTTCNNNNNNVTIKIEQSFEAAVPAANSRSPNTTSTSMTMMLPPNNGQNGFPMLQSVELEGTHHMFMNLKMTFCPAPLNITTTTVPSLLDQPVSIVQALSPSYELPKVIVVETQTICESTSIQSTHETKPSCLSLWKYCPLFQMLREKFLSKLNKRRTYIIDIYNRQTTVKKEIYKPLFSCISWSEELKLYRRVMDTTKRQIEKCFETHHTCLTIDDPNWRTTFEKIDIYHEMLIHTLETIENLELGQIYGGFVRDFVANGETLFFMEFNDIDVKAFPRMNLNPVSIFLSHEKKSRLDGIKSLFSPYICNLNVKPSSYGPEKQIGNHGWGLDIHIMDPNGYFTFPIDLNFHCFKHCDFDVNQLVFTGMKVRCGWMNPINRFVSDETLVKQIIEKRFKLCIPRTGEPLINHHKIPHCHYTPGSSPVERQAAKLKARIANMTAKGWTCEYPLCKVTPAECIFSSQSLHTEGW